MNLKGKTAIITGSSGGIGRALAKQLYAKGVNLTLTGRRIDKLKALAKDIESNGKKPLIIPADLRDENDITNLFKQSQKHWNGLDILINNAAEGIDAPLLDGPTDAWRKMLEVNVLAVAITMREALKYFDLQTGGYIINVSSTSAYRVPTQGKFYTATKFAVRALSEVLQQELNETGSLTKISCISPGRVATNMFKDPDAPSPNNKNLEELNPEDVAQAIIYQLKSPRHVIIRDIILHSNKQKF